MFESWTAEPRLPSLMSSARTAADSTVRILLTGAAGFIGSRIWAALTAAGHEVVAIDAMLSAAHGDGALPPDGCRIQDVRDAEALAGLLKGIDMVCHQAAVVGAGVNAADAPSYGSHNDFGTTVLLAQMYAIRLMLNGQSPVIVDKQASAITASQRYGMCHVSLNVFIALIFDA